MGPCGTTLPPPSVVPLQALLAGTPIPQKTIHWVESAALLAETLLDATQQHARGLLVGLANLVPYIVVVHLSTAERTAIHLHTLSQM